MTATDSFSQLDLANQLDRARVHLDLPHHLVDQLFGQHRVGRLAELADLSAGPLRPGQADEFDVVITGWGSAPLPEQRPASSTLSLIAHSAGSVRSLIPVQAIRDGIKVSHAAAAMTESVAEHAIGLTLDLLRRTTQLDRHLKDTREWVMFGDAPVGTTLAGATVGIIGAGRIGRHYLRLVQAFGATAVVYDPHLTATRAAELRVTALPLDQLLQCCDVIALHAPVTTETEAMIGTPELAMMRDGAVLINTARAALIDQTALHDELCRGRLYAGLDVFHTEPLPADNPLLDLPNVVLTPHIGAFTHHSRHHQGDLTINEVERFLTHQPLHHEITADRYFLLA